MAAVGRRAAAAAAAEGVVAVEADTVEQPPAANKLLLLPPLPPLLLPSRFRFESPISRSWEESNLRASTRWAKVSCSVTSSRSVATPPG